MTKLTYWIEREWEGLLGWFFFSRASKNDGPGALAGLLFMAVAILLPAMALDVLCTAGQWQFWDWIWLLTGSAAGAFVAYLIVLGAIAHAKT